jgi:hypothetical protein
MNSAQQHAAQFWQSMTRGNPYEKIYSALADPIEKVIEDRVERILSQRMEQSKSQDVISRFESEHGTWLYQTDPSTGQRVLSDRGRQFTDKIQELREQGIRSPEKLLEYAQQMTGIAPSQPQQPAAVQNTGVAPKAKQPVSQEAQQQTFLEGAQRRAQHSPSARGRVSEDAPQVMTMGDLESLFVRAQRAKSAV